MALMSAHSIPPVRGITDLPSGVLCDIVQHCCGNNPYKLANLTAAGKAFRSPVSMVRACEIDVADVCH